MGKNYFTNEQVNDLRCNPYVKKVSEKAITYEEGFKEVFIEKYESDSLPSQIFIECGFDPKVLGKERITNFTRRVRKQHERMDGFKDTRAINSGRPRTKELSKDEQIEQLNNKVNVLKQENDFLKRVRYINKKQISKQSKKELQKKNSN